MINAAKKVIQTQVKMIGETAKNPRSYLPVILLGAIALVLFGNGMIKKLINKYKAWKMNRDTKNGTVNVPDGTHTVVDKQGTKTINLYLIAQAIYDAIYNYYGGLAEDESEMINQIKQVPKSLIPNLAAEYSKISTKGRSIQAEFIKYVSASELKTSGVWTLIN